MKTTSKFFGLLFLITSIGINAMGIEMPERNTIQKTKTGDIYIYGSVKNGTNPVVGAKVQIVLNWTSNSAGWQSLSVLTDAQGNYSYLLPPDYINGKGGTVSTNTWDNGGVAYFPSAGYAFPTFSESQQCNFNSQQNSIAVDILTGNTLTASAGSALQLEATVSIISGTIDSVLFEIDGQSIAGVNSSANSWTANWIPSSVDATYNLVVKAYGDGITGEKTASINIVCSGTGCPNKKPVISSVIPTGSIEQQAIFIPISVGANIVDPDGSITNVTITVDGVSQTVSSSGNSYSCEFTPGAYKTYTIVITATDNTGASSSFTKEYTVRTASAFTPIPDWVVVGYHHTTFSNGTFGSQTLADLVSSGYNSINCSFIETTDGYIPKFEVSYSGQGAGPYNNNTAQMKNDIKLLQAAGKPVLVSIGGANGHIELTTNTQREAFVSGIISIVEEYGFDGIDLDFEGGTMAYPFPANSWTYDEVAYPKLDNIVKAVRAISNYFGPDFIITAAPETQYIQGATSAYATGWGSFLIVVDNIRDILDYIHVQLYNTGSQTASNGQSYTQGTPNFVVSMTDMLIQGFNTASGLYFEGLRPDQVAVGLPSCPAAAPAGGYINPTKVIEALNYLTKGTKGPNITYTLLGTHYPNLRGVMTWSTNWDASVNFEFATNYSNYHNSPVTNIDQSLPQTEEQILVISNGSTTNINAKETCKVAIYNSNGVCVNKLNLKIGNNIVDTSGYLSGIYLFVTISETGNCFSQKFVIK